MIPMKTVKRKNDRICKKWSMTQAFVIRNEQSIAPSDSERFTFQGLSGLRGIRLENRTLQIPLPLECWQPPNGNMI